MAVSAKGIFILFVLLGLFYFVAYQYNLPKISSTSRSAPSIPVPKAAIVPPPPTTPISQSLANTTPPDLDTTACASPITIDIGELEKLTFQLINQERTNHDLGSLKWDDIISATGRDHSKDMGINNYFSHQDFDGNFADVRLKHHNYLSFEVEGENLALLPAYPYYFTYPNGTICSPHYYSTSELAQLAAISWMNSPEHRANILLPNFTDSGMGIYFINNSYYFTQVFVKYTDCGYTGVNCCHEGTEYFCYQPYDCTRDGGSFVCK
ncbi:CAP domain-containing protein [Candidatus Micrarchaeota archaeon]|nr:CAP domain-containing protein [Candidatus Micrarchaeota archaeon]